MKRFSIAAHYPSAIGRKINIGRCELLCMPGGAGNYISASKIRKAIKHDKLNEVIDFLPDSTRDFLYSDESLGIREKIKAGKGRH